MEFLISREKFPNFGKFPLNTHWPSPALDKHFVLRLAGLSRRQHRFSFPLSSSPESRADALAQVLFRGPTLNALLLQK